LAGIFFSTAQLSTFFWRELGPVPDPDAVRRLRQGVQLVQQAEVAPAENLRKTAVPKLKKEQNEDLAGLAYRTRG
jgi:hypothetical protein